MEPVFRIDREEQNFLSYERYENDSSILCFHSQIEIYFVDEGEMVITVNHNRRVLKGGELSVALSFDAHTYSTPRASKSSALFIPVYMCPEFTELVKNKRVISPFISDRNVFMQIKELSEKLSVCKNNHIKMQGYIYLILGIIMENIFFESAEKLPDSGLGTRLLMYINDNFRESISLSTVARELGYNKSYISRYFKHCFKIGFNRYLTTVRLKNVLMLMAEKKHTLTYCAMESGFLSLRTFYRAFRSEFGCAPKSYLEQMTKLDKINDLV